MSRPLRIEYPEAFYHITVRGNERKDIYRDDRDREQFLSYLESAVVRYGAAIHVYCLMGNHYHLLMSTPAGNLAQILRHINGAYTNYYNSRHRRSGHLFQGRYRAILVEADEYAGQLSRYIHLNPVRAGIVSDPRDYSWSSYSAYTGEKRSPAWLTTKWLLKYFGGRSAQKVYRKFVEAKLDVPEEDPLREAIGSAILGRWDFVDEIKEKYLKGRSSDRDLPALATLIRVTPEKIDRNTQQEFQGKPELARKVAIYLCHRFSNVPLREIGNHFSVGESAVSQASRRFQVELSLDKTLRKKVEGVRRGLRVCNV